MDKHDEAKKWIEDQGHYNGSLHIDENSRVDLYLSDVLADYHEHLESKLKNHGEIGGVSVSFCAEDLEKVDKYHKQTLDKVNKLYKYLYDRQICATEYEF